MMRVTRHAAALVLGLTTAYLGAAVLAAPPAAAQAIQSTPLPPPPGTSVPLAAPPAPGTVPTPGQSAPDQTTPDQTPPGQTAPNAIAPGTPTTPDQPAATPVQPAPDQTIRGGWEPQGRVVLRALNKITARATTVTGKVGATLHFGTLDIVARRCVVRPPGQELGAAAFLDITDTAPGASKSTDFHGWMFSTYPALAMLQHPTYDIHLAGCAP